MQHRPQSTYRNSGLARTKVKQNKFVALCSRIFMQSSEIGLVEDRSNSTTIIRIIVGLLLVHLIIIGGIILHGKVDNTLPTEGSALAAPPTAATLNLTAPGSAITTPSTPVAPPAPVPGPTVNPTPHITQNTPANAEETATPTPVVADTPKPDTPASDTATPAHDAPYKTVTVVSGDTLYSIAQRNGVTQEAILAINPAIKDPARLSAGNKIRIPLPADSDEAKQAAAQREAERIEAEGLPYVVQPGDNLSKLERRFGTTIKAIQKLNNMGNSVDLKAGQTLMIPATPKAKQKLLKK